MKKVFSSSIRRTNDNCNPYTDNAVPISVLEHSIADQRIPWNFQDQDQSRLSDSAYNPENNFGILHFYQLIVQIVARFTANSYSLRVSESGGAA